MKLKYMIVQKRKPGDANSPYKYYPQPRNNGEADLKSIARKIQQYTGQNYVDIFGVLAALEDIITEELKNGLILKLGNIGKLYLTYKTEPGETPEEVTLHNIKGARICFRPSCELLEEVNDALTFEKVKQ